jgi:YegS/Rv2252/BmrU family lipid kinase
LKTRFIYNPRSGHIAKNPHLPERARRFIEENKLDGSLVQTERARHASELARRAVDDGCELIVAIGGDGTMNEVASALIDSPATFGLIPCGSGNGLGRHLGIPRPDAGDGAFQNLVNGHIRSIDTGTANGLPFFNTMGVGFDAEISHRFNRLVRRGLPAYIRTTFATLLGFRSQPYVIRCGDMSLATSAFIISVANSDQYGNDCYIAPGARIDDGRLNITILKSIHPFNALPIAIRLFTKSIDGSASVQRLAGPRFSIERRSPGLLHTDGETHETAALIEIAVRPRSLRILVPHEEAPAPA